VVDDLITGQTARFQLFVTQRIQKLYLTHAPVRIDDFLKKSENLCENAVT
jgi:hypothetical protein